ncbi:MULTISPECIES: hypothetical protein [Sorangium]|uniref:VWFA domain-containing protein n=1 Tax=Sorangium cellulosum TaxID=56 RepID=A0A4P2QK12_SORCE|nr:MULTISPECIES: hypothetical protein [Sorangium]AUX30235.1 uncharacterized protein SOCE836_023340 [Sorangium cellulosum]WCQ89628.1 hypothetical protein NQZ70_02319 [Sorangium sp. Soce836]
MELRAWCAALCAGMVGLVACGGDSGTNDDSGSPGAASGGSQGQGGDIFGSGSGPFGQGGGSFGNGVSGATGGTGGSGANSAGCQHVDVVFALDNSSSMNEEKQSMREVVFPAFAQALLDISGIQDFRAAVIDACPRPANFHTRGAAGQCSFQSGQAWMDSSSSELTGEFQCAADLYVDDVQCSGNNDDEQPASAVAAALEPPFSQEENAGFVRDDALLVVVVITDEDEQPVPRQEPQAIHDRLVKVKGDAKNVVFLGIGGKTDCEGAYGSADEARNLQRLVNTFSSDGRGFFWDLCAGRLEDGLTNALTAIEEACEEFVPVVN